MKKYGILTYHRADNLGAVLQAYALQTALAEHGAEGEILDYVCETVEGTAPKGTGIKALAYQGYHFWKHQGFVRFRRRYLNLSAECTGETIGKLAQKYDGVITGSDQVWNYECSGWDDTYFLPFVSPEKKKYAYAASLGQYRFAPEEQPHIRELLSDFTAISVREKSAREHLQSFSAAPVRVCADPVVLLTAQQWQKIMKPRLLKKKYVFVYLIMPSGEVLRRAQEYARNHDCQVICNKTSPEFILHGSPPDFLSWVAHAECVFTNSFHGTAFSLILGKAFAAETRHPDGAVNSRVAEILERVGAGQCALETAADPVKPECQSALELLRQEGHQYLEEICS